MKFLFSDSCWHSKGEVHAGAGSIADVPADEVQALILAGRGRVVTQAELDKAAADEAEAAAAAKAAKEAADKAAKEAADKAEADKIEALKADSAALKAASKK